MRLYEKHGMTGTVLHGIWKDMRKRCSTNERYYKRGIVVCDRWDSFLAFKEDMGDTYSAGLSIDRINNDGNYKPSNCRWTTSTIQARNTRRIKITNTSGFRGVSAYCEKWRARISVCGKNKSLGMYDYPWTGAYAYDAYILQNNLEHTRNFS